MSKLFFELSGEHELLSGAEIRGCAESEGFRLVTANRGPGFLVAGTNAPPGLFSRRCGLLWSVNEVLFECGAEQFFDYLDIYLADYGKREEGRSFCVRARVKRQGNGKQEASLPDSMEVQKRAGAMIKAATGMNVKLEEPDVVFRILFSQGQAVVGIERARVNRSELEERKVQNRPFFSPISIHPKYARVLINLGRAGTGKRLLDPFCGTGGILIEAAKMGVEALGSDISEDMVEGSLKNLAYERERAVVKRCDVSEIGRKFGKVDAIVTDPPYGRASSTNREEVKELYTRMLLAMSDALEDGGYVALVVPDTNLLDPLPENLSLIEKYSLKVHRSLTRHFVVLKK